MQIIHRGERRDACTREREGNNCEASCATCQPSYMMFFFFFFSSEVYRFLSIVPRTHCASSVFHSAFMVTEHTKKGKITFRTRCMSPLSHLLFFLSDVHTHFSFFFLARKFTVTPKKLKANPSWQSKIEKKCIKNFIHCNMYICMCVICNYHTFNLILRI